MEQKAELRARIAGLRAGWEAGYLAESDRAIERRLLNLPEWRAARTVFSYVGVRDEPSTRGILVSALGGGKRLCVPRCEGRGIMRAREIFSPDELRPAPFGLLEPEESAPTVPAEEIELAIVPCMAADRRGYRLGHGAGYYDRYLANLRCPTICLCRGRALLPALPVEEHDVRVEMVLTEAELLRTAGQAPAE
ncbi:MAG: 5-formyltetrahydrofolate cyclo-ligase [Clostridiales bacterium]|nr:5-formyltetrahydrofolate cyclo-ligase [Clostridiales bacterium]